MNTKRRRSSNKKSEGNHARDLSGVRSVSTNIEHKENQSKNFVSTVHESPERKNNKTRRRNKNRSKNNNTNPHDKNQRNNQGKDEGNKRAVLYTEHTRHELKRQFLKVEMQKYTGVKSRKLHKSLIDRKANVPYGTLEYNTGICPICNKNITNMMTFIIDEDTQLPAHFDCIYDKLRDKYSLKENERLSYVGNGAFAVIEDYKDGQVYKFKIKEKIQVVESRSAK